MCVCLPFVKWLSHILSGIRLTDKCLLSISSLCPGSYVMCLWNESLPSGMTLEDIRNYEARMNKETNDKVMAGKRHSSSGSRHSSTTSRHSSTASTSEWKHLHCTKRFHHTNSTGVSNAVCQILLWCVHVCVCQLPFLWIACCLFVVLIKVWIIAYPGIRICLLKGSIIIPWRCTIVAWTVWDTAYYVHMKENSCVGKISSSVRWWSECQRRNTTTTKGVSVVCVLMNLKNEMFYVYVHFMHLLYLQKLLFFLFFFRDTCVYF